MLHNLLLASKPPQGTYVRRISDGKLEGCNTAFAKLLGYDNIEECIQNYVPPNHYSRTEDHDYFLDLLKKKGFVVMHEARFSLPNGKESNVQYSAYLSREKTHVEGVVTSVTEQPPLAGSADRSPQHLDRRFPASHLLNYLGRQQQSVLTELESKMLANVQDFILPYLDRIDQEDLSQQGKTQLDMARSLLMDITSPFAVNLSSKYRRLTPVERKVADMIRRGLSSKEIANTLCVSVNTVTVHRHRIRKKLGLTNKKTNLCSYLMSLDRRHTSVPIP
ncbi:regulatory protein, luxR family [Desulforhopalus singaporensis]|uniref:Regulatory protein, luxR family n=2 Tax=Desulforhopalus singaporensis TaxID=91360 RepID=A0A1H0NA75_9BACT|nr:regulatory protein, luxR family [Desulforhopalus singaporensis]